MLTTSLMVCTAKSLICLETNKNGFLGFWLCFFGYRKVWVFMTSKLLSLRALGQVLNADYEPGFKSAIQLCHVAIGTAIQSASLRWSVSRLGAHIRIKRDPDTQCMSASPVAWLLMTYPFGIMQIMWAIQ